MSILITATDNDEQWRQTKLKSPGENYETCNRRKKKKVGIYEKDNDVWKNLSTWKTKMLAW